MKSPEVLALIGLSSLALRASAQVVPGPTWDRAETPESAGWSSERLAGAWTIAGQIGSGAVVVVSGGRIVAEWGETARRFPVYSLRKQLLSSLIGQEIAAGRLSLEATLAELGIDEERALTARERSATLRDLLSSRSGVYLDAAYEERELAAARPARGSHAPGAHFYYNNWDFNALGTVFERSSGLGIFEAFRDRIARPIGMEDFRIEDTGYRRERVSRHPAYLFEMTARDLARYGLLWLRRGRWGDVQIVPEDWIAQSTTSITRGAIHQLQDFGLLWWVYPRTPSSFGASGKGAQKIFVWPERDLVVVHLATAPLLPGLGRTVSNVDFWRLLSAITAAAPRLPSSPR